MTHVFAHTRIHPYIQYLITGVITTIVGKKLNTSITPALYHLLLNGFNSWTRLGIGCPAPVYFGVYSPDVALSVSLLSVVFGEGFCPRERNSWCPFYCMAATHSPSLYSQRGGTCGQRSFVGAFARTMLPKCTLGRSCIRPALGRGQAIKKPKERICFL